MKKNSDGPSQDQAGGSPSRLIDARIKELGDWRGETLAQIRKLIRQADPDVVEEWKWERGSGLVADGIICTGETYKTTVKLTFAKGASLDDPCGPLQLEPRGQHAPRHRSPRRRAGRRGGAEGAGPRGGDAERGDEGCPHAKEEARLIAGTGKGTSASRCPLLGLRCGQPRGEAGRSQRLPGPPRAGRTRPAHIVPLGMVAQAGRIRAHPSPLSPAKRLSALSRE